MMMEGKGMNKYTEGKKGKKRKEKKACGIDELKKNLKKKRLSSSYFYYLIITSINTAP